MAKQRVICSVCDMELPERQSSSGVDVLYVKGDECRKCRKKTLSEGPPSREFRAVIPPGKIGVTGFEEVKVPKAPLFMCKVKP